jgi:hypothetical protein
MLSIVVPIVDFAIGFAACLCCSERHDLATRFFVHTRSWQAMRRGEMTAGQLTWRASKGRRCIGPVASSLAAIEDDEE